MPARSERDASILVPTLALTLVYAVLRYHVFGTVPWGDLPLFTMNKAVSWSAVLLLLFAALRRRSGRDLGALERQALALTGLHLVLSLMVLTPTWFPKFFTAPGGRFTLAAGASMLAGAVAAMFAIAPRRSVRVRVLAPALVALHAGLIGFGNWFRPAGWPGYMVPISLLSCLAAVAVLALRTRRLENRYHEPDSRPERSEPPEAPP